MWATIDAFNRGYRATIGDVPPPRKVKRVRLTPLWDDGQFEEFDLHPLGGNPEQWAGKPSSNTTLPVKNMTIRIEFDDEGGENGSCDGPFFDTPKAFTMDDTCSPGGSIGCGRNGCKPST